MFDGPGPAGKAPFLLGRRTQHGSGSGGKPALQGVERPAGAYGRQDGGQLEALWPVVVNVAGGDVLDPLFDGQAGHGVVAGEIHGIAVVPELDTHMLPAEALDESPQLPAGGGGTAVQDGLRNSTLPAAGQHLPVPTVSGGQGVEVEDGLAFLSACQMSFGDGGAQAAIALGITGQNNQMMAGGIRFTRPRSSGGQAQLGAEDGREVGGPGRLTEADHAVQPVMVGERQGT
jgi:hypothetical protein